MVAVSPGKIFFPTLCLVSVPDVDHDPTDERNILAAVLDLKDSKRYSTRLFCV